MQVVRIVFISCMKQTIIYSEILPEVVGKRPVWLVEILPVIYIGLKYTSLVWVVGPIITRGVLVVGTEFGFIDRMFYLNYRW